MKLTDFGIATFGDSELTSTGQLVGTPAYMAPEQLRARRVDERADIYGAGATLFEAATGLVLNSKHEPVADPHKAVLDVTGDAALAAALTQAVRDKEAERFPDVAAFAQALARTALAEPPEAPVPRRRVRRGYVAIAALAVVGGVAAAVIDHELGRGTAPSSGPARTIAVAILPFDDHVGDPRLDFAASGLAHLLGEQLGHVEHLEVLGYYRVRGHVRDPARFTDWETAARELGADMIVRGELARAGDRVRVSIIVERANGGNVERMAREVAIDQVPETVRTLAAGVATAVLGAPAELPPSAGRGFEIERELQLGVAAFERQDFDTSRGHLSAAVERDPALAEANYYLALLDWWQGLPVQDHIQRALGGSLDPTAREFLVGLQMLWDLDYPRGVDYFRELARRAPDQRDVQYGLFEALYHGGHAAEAMAAYHRLRELAPGFYVGIEHPLSYYLARDDEKEIRWTRERWEIPAAERELWDARSKMADKSYADAVRILERVQEEHPGAAAESSRDLVQAYAVTGQLALARELAARLADDAPFRSLATYGLAVASGEDASAWRASASQAIGVAIPGMKPWEAWFALSALDLAAAKSNQLREDLARHERDQGHVAIVDIGMLILSDRLSNERAPEVARVAVFPQTSAAATAFTAQAAHDPKAAAAAWREVIDLDPDGRVALYAQWALANNLATLGDHAGVIAACDEVITPRVFGWAWATYVGPCLRASAEAATALGRNDDARRRWQKLLAFRSRAKPDDELVAAARAALAR